MYRIVAVQITDYDPSNNKEELEAIVRDLNKDAEQEDPINLTRWMVIPIAQFNIPDPV